MPKTDKAPKSKAPQNAKQRRVSPVVVGWIIAIAAALTVAGGYWYWEIDRDDDAVTAPREGQGSSGVSSDQAGTLSKLKQLEQEAQQIPEGDNTVRASRDGTYNIGDTEQTYRAVAARPTRGSANAMPQLALIIYHAGLDPELTRKAARLGSGFTLSFSPYGHENSPLSEEAHLYGQEILMDLPMEPLNYPETDPGPETLLTGVDPDRNTERLQTILGRGEHVRGVLGVHGSRFTLSAEALRPLIAALRNRDLLFVEMDPNSRSRMPELARSYGLPLHQAQMHLPRDVESQDEFEGFFVTLEEMALQDGRAVGVAEISPALIHRLAEWKKKLDGRGIQLTRISQLGM